MKISYLFFGLLCLVLFFFIGYAVSTIPFKITLILSIGVIFLILTILNVEIGLFLLIFVVPFTQQLTLGKFTGVPFDVGTDDVLILFIIISWLANLVRKKEPAFLKTSLNWPFFAFFTVAIFSFIGADVRFREGTILFGIFHLLKFYEYVLIYFIVISTINTVEQIRKYVTMFFVVVGILVATQFISMLMWGELGLAAPPSPRYAFLQTMYAFESNTYLGAYYAFFLSLLIAMILGSARGQSKFYLTFFAIVISFALFNTYSRSSYLGIFISVLIMASLKEKKLFLLILLLVVFSPIYMQGAIRERITITVQAIRPTLTLDPSATIRLIIWRKGLKIFLNNFLFGTGYWTSRWALGEAHSQYIAILIETGIVGFSIFSWLILRMFKNSLILLKKAGADFLKSLGLGYTAGLTAILTTCFFSEALEDFRISGSLWFVTGLVTSANRILAGRDREQEGELD